MLRDLDCKNAKGREKAYKLADSHGLYLYVTPKGHRSWRWNYRFRGKAATRTLGAYPEVSLADARIARAELDKLRRRGVDPAQASQQARLTQAVADEATFEKIARSWHAQRKQVWAHTTAASIMRGLEREVFPHLGSLPITQINARLVLSEVLKPIEQRGANDRAHRACQQISAIFEFAKASGLAEHDPAAKLTGALKPKANGRRPALRTIEDARALLLAAEAEPGQPLTKLASRLLAITAARSGSLRHAEPHEFEDLDGPEPIWRIPASKMKLDVKQKQMEEFEFIVPLPPQAVEIVKLAIQFTGGGRYVFPNTRSANKPMSDGALSMMYRRLPQFATRHVPHGWRATFSTIMNERAQELDRPGDRAIIDLMLAHKPPGVEPLYNRATFKNRRRKIAEEWAELLLGPLPPAASVFEGRRR